MRVKIEEKQLLQFIKDIKTFINNHDEIMKKKEPVERGKLLAREMNKLNFSFDTFLHFACKIPFSKFNSINNKTFKISKQLKKELSDE